MTTKRWLCIHAHFYQPPRENPWLEQIEYQSSAYPFHDWNERITAECYAPNAVSRILDKKGWVTGLTNNYSKINFNFGPTLLSWMEEHNPETYEAILEGDRLGQKLFGGHGPAIAQAYNHMILPLASHRDRETQIKWGIKDFERRFSRYPESMWLPETAVDLTTLDILSEHGMKYVILAPRQAKRFRSVADGSDWQSADNEAINPTKPYFVQLPSGRTIAAFFYDGPVSRAVAFEGLLHNGEYFANRLMDIFNHENHDHEQLAHIATDGETYGHHHRHGEMALSYALHYIEEKKLAQITNYGQYLELHPPQTEVEIHDNSSWSCAHGIERWRSDCGCNSGGRGNWNQKWRAPLRESFNKLQQEIDPIYEESLKKFEVDPWMLRNEYIDLILDRSEETRAAWLQKHLPNKDHGPEAQHNLLSALEMQRHSLLMYTSCGWFFDELSGIETVQNIKYAYRAIQLAKQLSDQNLGEHFKANLQLAPSNLPELKNGKIIWEKYVEPARVDLMRVGAHFMASNLFGDAENDTILFSFLIRIFDFEKLTAGKAQLSYGRIRIQSVITLEEADFTIAVIHFGDHNINIGVRHCSDSQNYRNFTSSLKDAFSRADLPEVIRKFDKNFPRSNIYTLKDLFYDEQRRVLDQILSQTLSEVESTFQQLYDRYFPLICYLSDIQAPLPKVFHSISEFIQNTGVKRSLDMENPKAEQVLQYIHSAQTSGVNIDHQGITLHIQNRMRQLMEDYLEHAETETLSTLLDLIKATQKMPFEVELWSLQNRYFLWIKEQDLSKLDKTELELLNKISKELKIKLEISSGGLA